jgi:two-component system, chemotaxis family, sensor kinase Cph1
VTPAGPAFGQADLSNCERELIHLAGSVQPHGLLLSVREPALQLIQASANVAELLGTAPADLLGQPLRELGGDLDAQVRRLVGADLVEPVPLRCAVRAHGQLASFDGSLHRVAGQGLVIELEPLVPPVPGVPVVDLAEVDLADHLSRAVQRFSGAATIGTLADAVVKCFRDLAGYDRVMVYKFDPDGHGKIIAEARDPRLEPLLGHHYPASDIPQRARELYIRNRVRLLVDVNYRAAALMPRILPDGMSELDMSMCTLRSMSPLHLQYLRNMGVTATLVVSLVREGRLWGLVACHHYSPRNLRFAVRAAADLLAEVIATRIAAIENYAHAQVAIQVRRLEQRLIEATSTEGDWRLALLRNPRTLLQPLDATGAALFYDGEVLSAGEVPSTPQLRALMQWIDADADGRRSDGLFSCSAVEQANAELSALTPTASGVIAVKLSTDRPDYLMWFRKEQLLTVTWAGDPTKPVVGNDPLELSPRRSFAAWSEIVRGTALPWTGGEIALARAIGVALIDIIVQVNAVRLLIAEHQLAQVRATVGGSNEAVIVTDARGRTLFANEALLRLLQAGREDLPDLDALAGRFTAAAQARRVFDGLASDGSSWRGEFTLAGTVPTPVALRAEVVPARDGSVLGTILMLDDLTESKRVLQARQHLEQSLSEPVAGLAVRDSDELIRAILSNASLAAMDIADGQTAPSAAPLLEELEASTRRAAALYARIRSFAAKH